MTLPGQHPSDDTLSSLVDEQLAPDELALAHAHVQHCAECQSRLADLHSVVAVLRALPSLAPPRDFRLAAQPESGARQSAAAEAPRPIVARLDVVAAAQRNVAGLHVVADPPNVIRLRRWYSVARTGAASLAAIFVFLSVGALYVGSQPVSVSSSSETRPLNAPPPGAAPAEGAPAAAVPAASPQPASAVRAADPAAQSAPAASAAQSAPAPTQSAPAALSAPAAAGAPPAAPNAVAPAAGAAQAARPQNAAPAGNADTAADQTAAATSVRALPTPFPTPTALRPPTSSPQPISSTTASTAAPLWIAAALVGGLALLGLLLTLVVRHRLKAATLIQE